MDKRLLLGNEAIARGAYEAGVKFVSAYPGTPSTEVTESLAKYEDIYVEWSPNEKVALEIAIGSSIGGNRSICSMKHVGLNVAADPLFTSSYTGINGGLVIVVADDPGVFSSQNEQDSRYYALSSHIPMLEPSDSTEAKEFTKLAFEISEKYDTPVFIRMTTRVAHSQSLVEPSERNDVPKKEYKKDISKYVMTPAYAKEKHKVVCDREINLSKLSNTLDINRIEKGNKVGIICSGIIYEYVKESYPDASIFKIGMVHPLPIEKIKEFSKSVENLYVLEELEPFIEMQLKANGISCKGKELFSRVGEYSSSEIAKVLLNKPVEKNNNEDLPKRPPIMCAGCTHRGVFYALKELNAIVCGDIGCYTLGSQPPLSSIDMVVCMGASIGMAMGLKRSNPNKDVVAVIGDSTFIHSGITGLIDAVYNKTDLTLVILDNRTTGMTGHQQHPGTGKTIRLEETNMLDLEKVCISCGANSVSVIDPYDLNETKESIIKSLKSKGVNVIIARKPCALIVKHNTHFEITNDCKKCKTCLTLGCPAISIIDGNITIDKNTCTGCGLCSQLCKLNTIKEVVNG